MISGRILKSSNLEHETKSAQADTDPEPSGNALIVLQELRRRGTSYRRDLQDVQITPAKYGGLRHAVYEALNILEWPGSRTYSGYIRSFKWDKDDGGGYSDEDQFELTWRGHVFLEELDHKQSVPLLPRTRILIYILNHGGKVRLGHIHADFPDIPDRTSVLGELYRAGIIRPVQTGPTERWIEIADSTQAQALVQSDRGRDPRIWVTGTLAKTIVALLVESKAPITELQIQRHFDPDAAGPTSPYRLPSQSQLAPFIKEMVRFGLIAEVANGRFVPLSPGIQLAQRYWAEEDHKQQERIQRETSLIDARGHPVDINMTLEQLGAKNYEPVQNTKIIRIITKRERLTALSSQVKTHDIIGFELDNGYRLWFVFAHKAWAHPPDGRVSAGWSHDYHALGIGMVRPDGIHTLDLARSQALIGERIQAVVPHNQINQKRLEHVRLVKESGYRVGDEFSDHFLDYHVNDHGYGVLLATGEMLVSYLPPETSPNHHTYIGTVLVDGTWIVARQRANRGLQGILLPDLINLVAEYAGDDGEFAENAVLQTEKAYFEMNPRTFRSKHRSKRKTIKNRRQRRGRSRSRSSSRERPQKRKTAIDNSASSSASASASASATVDSDDDVLMGDVKSISSSASSSASASAAATPPRSRIVVAPPPPRPPPPLPVGVPPLIGLPPARPAPRIDVTLDDILGSMSTLR